MSFSVLNQKIYKNLEGSASSIKHPLFGRRIPFNRVSHYRDEMKEECDSMQSKVKDKSKTTVKHEINDNGMVIERRFTTAGEDPFDLFSWISMDVEIRNPDGTMADSIEGVEFPSGFEGVPGKIAAQKYLRKAGVPVYLRKVAEDGIPVWLQRSEPDYEKLQTLDAKDRYTGEIHGKNLFRRLAGTWTYW